MSQVDIHMIRSPRGSKGALGSFFDAQADRLKHPRIVVREAPFVAGSVIEARLQGFSLGTSPYVSWVDDDGDQVLDIQWIDAALDLLDANPQAAAVFPQWHAVLDGQVVHTSMVDPQPHAVSPHHMTIMRRANVMPMLQELRDQFPNMMCGQELMLTYGSLRFGQLVYQPTLAYSWAQHPSGASKATQDAYMAAFVYGHIQESLSHL